MNPASGSLAFGNESAYFQIAVHEAGICDQLIEERKHESMGRFLIEVPHDVTPGECGRAIELLLRSGSHFISAADFGCPDGVHKGWMIVDVDTKEEAASLVPPAYRTRATIVRLQKFTIDDLGTILAQHNFDKKPE